MLHWLTRAYLGHRAAGRGYLGPELRLQLQFAGIFRSCANILHTPESAVRCGPVTSWRLQLQWCNSQQLPASHNCCCPRPELWASTCLAQSVLSGEKCHHMCLESSSLAGGGGGGGALRPEHTTPLTPAVVRWPGPARPGRRGPVAAARLRAPPSGPAPTAASACGLRARLSCYPHHPPLRGTTAEAFGFNKPLEIVKPGVWCRVLGCLRCCVWSLAVKLIQCKLNPM